MYFLIFTVVWIRWTFPRTQFYGLLNLSWKILIPVSLVTLILSSAMMKLLPLMKNSLKEIATGFNSLLTGMRITLGQFFKPNVTVQYPHESLKMPERFRGHIELVRDPETGKALCFACKLCERACPSDCITVEGVKLDGRQEEVRHQLHPRLHQVQPLRLLRRSLPRRRHPLFARVQPGQHSTRKTTSWTSSSAWKRKPSRWCSGAGVPACQFPGRPARCSAPGTAQILRRRTCPSRAPLDPQLSAPGCH